MVDSTFRLHEHNEGMNVEAVAPETGPERTFFDGLRAGRFNIQQCLGCRRHVFYPRALCPGCGSRELEWVKASGGATVHSTTVVRRKSEAGGDYNIALVDLAEGPRMMSRVEGIPPDQVRIGLRVEARIRAEGESNIIIFVPEGMAP